MKNLPKLLILIGISTIGIFAQSAITPSDIDGRWKGSDKLEYAFQATPDGQITMRVKGREYRESMRFKGRFNGTLFKVTAPVKRENINRALPVAIIDALLKKSISYSYDVRPKNKNRIILTEYIHGVTRNGSVLKSVNLNQFKKEITLTRMRECSESADTIEKQIIDGEYADRLLLVLGPSDPLPSGSIIAENSLISREVIKVNKPSCFFFIDLVPTAMFAHPVLYVLSDKETGKITDRKWAVSPPLITNPDSNNGIATAYYQTIEDRITSTDRLLPKNEKDLDRPVKDAPFRPVHPDLGGPVTARFESGLRPFKNVHSFFREINFNPSERLDVPPCTKTKKIALLVNGGKDNAYNYNIRKVSAIMKQLGFDKIVKRNWKQHSVADVRKSIQDLTKGLGNCDVFVIYITAHVLGGNVGRVATAGYKTDGEILYNHGRGPGGSLHPWSLSNKKINSVSIDPSKKDTGPGLLYSLRNVNAGRIQIILDMCNAGLLVDATNGLSPKWGGPPISKYLSKNQKLSILAATKRDQWCDFATRAAPWGFEYMRRGDATDLGGVFTQVFVKRFLDQIQRKVVDSNSDGKIDLSEYYLASKKAMKDTKDRFTGWIAKKIKKRTQNPQSVEIVGTAP